jgi:hypothetical protein
LAFFVLKREREETIMRELNSDELVQVSGGTLTTCPPPPPCCYCPPPPCPEEPREKGNNGWGQEKNKGINDGTNAGSDNGNLAQSSTKTASVER